MKCLKFMLKNWEFVKSRSDWINTKLTLILSSSSNWRCFNSWLPAIWISFITRWNASKSFFIWEPRECNCGKYSSMTVLSSFPLKKINYFKFKKKFKRSRIITFCKAPNSILDSFKDFSMRPISLATPIILRNTASLIGSNLTNKEAN